MEVTDIDKALLREKLKVEEENLFYLRHPYLTMVNFVQYIIILSQAAPYAGFVYVSSARNILIAIIYVLVQLLWHVKVQIKLNLK
jgi:hypothetical protein